jgi:feruloyl esterase
MRLSALLLAPLVTVSAPAAASCDALVGLRLDKVTLLAADAVPAGDFQPPAAFGPPPRALPLPSHCRVRAVATPVPGSRIGFELWLPEQDWNGRLKMFGNGGYSSALPYAQLAAGVSAGYAVTATDTGHQGEDPDFAVGLPEAIADWGHRAVHVSVVHARALLRAYYGKPAARAYFEGCSTGGHQALMSAQRYPNDFDGIIAGAPGNNRTRLNIGFLWQFAVNRRPGSSEPVLTAAKLPLLAGAALAQCGNAAERARGYLENPFDCRVDVSKLQCRAGEGPDCLGAEQVGVAEKMYGGARNPRTGAQLYPPWLPGSEPGWAAYWADPRNPRQPARASFFRFWAFHDAAWDWRSFDFDRSMARIDPGLARKIDAVDPDLSRFSRAGGKIILYHGLADPVVSPWDTRRYFDAVERHAGGRASFARLFFAPGMSHCGGGPGPNMIAAQDAIEQWVEDGVAPDGLPVRRMGASEPAGRLCPYPAIGGSCGRVR